MNDDDENNDDWKDRLAMWADIILMIACTIGIMILMLVAQART